MASKATAIFFMPPPLLTVHIQDCLSYCALIGIYESRLYVTGTMHIFDDGRKSVKRTRETVKT